jgi:ABC-2 type transport system ATP-binding protein
MADAGMDRGGMDPGGVDPEGVHRAGVDRAGRDPAGVDPTDVDLAISTERLSRRFGSIEAVHDVSLAVPDGSICGFIGANGAGKTTTLKLLMGLLRPTSGRAVVLGVDSQRLGPSELARIGYVSENQELPNEMSVRELLAYVRPFYPTWDDALAERLRRLLDLPLDQRLRTLSRGMRMKAALVASLAYRPRLVVMDEPFSGLDPVMRDDLVQGILELAGGDRWSAIISSHDLNEIERLIDYVAFLQEGRLIFAEPIAALQARFRQIEITAADGESLAAKLPAPTPASWFAMQSSDRTLRFVHSQYLGADTERDLAARFPGAEIQTGPVSLRDTFVALARERRRLREEEARA